MCGIRIMISFKRHSVGEEVIIANPGSKMCEKANQSYCVRVMVEMSVLLPFIPALAILIAVSEYFLLLLLKLHRDKSYRLSAATA